ncbi:MAG TPA: cobalamin-dependent protein [bacterium]|nr:cobalamin-dependent protein [bacterium]
MSRIRVLIGMLGLDQHEGGAVAVSALLRDAGMEVIYAGCFQTPDTLVRAALQEDADVIGLSCHSWEYLHYVPQLMARLREQEMEVPVVVGGSVLTPDDERALAELGVAATFGAGAPATAIIERIRALALGGSTAQASDVRPSRGDRP